MSDQVVFGVGGQAGGRSKQGRDQIRCIKSSQV